MDYVLFYLRLVGFGEEGWGLLLLRAAAMTLAVSLAAFAFGGMLGALGAWAKIAGARPVRLLAEGYTTTIRGVPDLLVIYLFYFGGSQVLTTIGHALGGEGFFGLNGFMVGMLAVGFVSGAYQTETLRGGYAAIPHGEIEAAQVMGMGRLLMLRRIIIPRVMRFALPGMGNIWQQVLKESTLISVTGLVEIIRQVHIGAGSTHRPFEFYITGLLLYLGLTALSGQAFRRAEYWTLRGERRTAG